MIKRAAIVLLVLWGAACAVQPARAPRTPGENDAPALAAAQERELGLRDRELAGLMAEARPVDCRRAALLRDNICGLAERICTLVGRTPEDRAGAARCTDASARCKSARERVRSACGS